MIELTHRMAKFREQAEKINKELVSPAAQAIDHNADISLEVMAALWDTGFMALGIPKEYGGTGAGVLEQALVMEWLSRGSASIGQRLVVQSLGLYPLLSVGTGEQKESFLKDVADRSLLTAFALSEPEDNGEQSPTETSAKLKDSHYVINGRKAYVSGSEQADLVILFAITDAEAGLKSGLSAFVISRGTQGMMFGEPMERAGLRGVPTAELVLDECRVPAEQRLGGEGQGYLIAEHALTATAPLAAAGAVGLAQAALDMTIERVNNRHPGHNMTSEFQPLEINLAQMSTRLQAARALTYNAALAWDKEKQDSLLLCRQAKVFATDTAMWVVDKAIQCLGTYAMTRHNPLERMLRDAKTMQVQLASNQVHEINIARGLLKSE